MSAKIDINRVAATAIETMLGEEHRERRSLTPRRAVAAGAAVAAAALAARRTPISTLVDIDRVRDAVRDRLSDAGLLDVDEEEPDEDWEAGEDDGADEPGEEDEDWDEESDDPVADEDEDWDEEDDEDGGSERPDNEDEEDDEEDEDDYDWEQAESEWDDEAKDDPADAGDGLHPAERPPKPPRRARQRNSAGRGR